MVNTKRAMAAVVFAALFVVFTSAAFSMPSGDYLVKEVIDGDTIVLENGETVRYVGVDTPEINEPFYLEAKARNATMVQGMLVNVLVCVAESRDKYGRVLAWVSSGGVPVNETLLKEGLARTLLIPPCGLVRGRQFRELEKEAKEGQRGIWGIAAKRAVREISPYVAHMHIGEMVRLRGRVSSIDVWGKSWTLNFRTPNGFRAVIIPKASDEFDRRRLNILDFRGKEVVITGIVTERGGRPEILIDSPSRIE